MVDNDPAGLIHSILSDASKEYALRAIRTLDIHVPGISLPPTEEQISARWQPLAALISHLTNLTHVQFKSSGGSSREPFPLLILQAIQTYHPAAKISMGYNWTRQGRRHLTEDGGKVTYPINSPTDPPELALCSSPNLDTLDLVISNSQAGEVVKAAYSRLIRLTPNLRNLTLREHIWGGCDSTMPEDDPWNPHGYGAFQTIKTAETWATGTPIRKEIRELRLEGVSLYEYTFDYWNEVLNFEKLELFEIKLGTLDACFFTAYGMPCLKTLNIDIGGFKHESQGPKRADFYGGLLDFLQNGPGLESLTLHGCDHPVFGKDSSGESSDQTSLVSTTHRILCLTPHHNPSFIP